MGPAVMTLMCCTNYVATQNQRMHDYICWVLTEMYVKKWEQWAGDWKERTSSLIRQVTNISLFAHTIDVFVQWSS